MTKKKGSKRVKPLLMRYRLQVDKKGQARVKASREGYLCKADDVVRLENMYRATQALEKESRLSLNDAVKNGKDLAAQLEDYSRQYNKALNLMHSVGLSDTVMATKLANRFSPRDYFRTLWLALTNRI